MSATLFGLCGSALVGLGLYGLVTNPHPLRKVLSFNLLGGGIFLLFGVVARRGAAAGLGGDPGTAGTDHHRDRGRIFGHRPRGRAAAATLQGDWRGQPEPE